MFFFFFNRDNIFNKFASARLQLAFNNIFFSKFLYDSVVIYQIIRIIAFPKLFSNKILLFI